MTTKTAQKTEPRAPRAAPSQDEVHAAYQCHTLASMLYGQIAATRPWLVQPPRAPAHPAFGPGAAPWTSPWPGRC